MVQPWICERPRKRNHRCSRKRFYADGQRTDDIIPDSTTRQITTIEGVEYKVYIFRTPQCGEMDIQIRYTKETGFLTTEENGCGC